MSRRKLTKATQRQAAQTKPQPQYRQEHGPSASQGSYENNSERIREYIEEQRSTKQLDNLILIKK